MGVQQALEEQAWLEGSGDWWRPQIGGNTLSVVWSRHVETQVTSQVSPGAGHSLPWRALDVSHGNLQPLQIMALGPSEWATYVKLILGWIWAFLWTLSWLLQLTNPFFRCCTPHSGRQIACCCLHWENWKGPISWLLVLLFLYQMPLLLPTVCFPQKFVSVTIMRANSHPSFQIPDATIMDRLQSLKAELRKLSTVDVLICIILCCGGLSWTL